MVRYIDDHRDLFGVEPICKVLQIAPSTYYEQKARERDPDRLPARAKRDEVLKPEIQRVYEENFCVYGARKIWKQLNRESIPVARCTTERLTAALGIFGAKRGKTWKTTTPDVDADRPRDLVQRTFTASAPNELWVADITYVSTWRNHVVYVAFIIDVFARRIVGWRVLNSLKTDIVLDALEQALYSRTGTEGLIHHSDRGSQYLSIRYTERLAEAGIESSVGSVGDSYDNALAETIIGLFKTEVIWRSGPWKTINEVEYATCAWVDWYNNRRLLQPIGDIPPAELEQAYYEQREGHAEAA
ncbi:IS3 family transposase [soil metagenome]